MRYSPQAICAGTNVTANSWWVLCQQKNRIESVAFEKSVPRARGADPKVLQFGLPISLCSPRTRGGPESLGRARLYVHVFPAHAADPYDGTNFADYDPCSPRTRG